MIKAEQIKKANELIQKTPIKGKDYAPVHERVKAFRAICPGGRIITEIINHDGKTVVMQASVYDDEGRIMAVGHAQEEKGKGMVNGTSYIENCETSAVGRALGFLGIGVDGEIASLDEVVSALEQQQDEIEMVREAPDTRINVKQIKGIVEQCAISGVSVAEVCDVIGIPGLEDMTYPQYWNLTKRWSEFVKHIKGGRDA